MTARAADPRIKVAVVAAPAIGFAFAPDGLKNVKVPVQLWRAENDLLVPHPRYAEAVRLALPPAQDYRVVLNAGHYDFLVPCSNALAPVAPSICSSAAGFDRPVSRTAHAVRSGALGRGAGNRLPVTATWGSGQYIKLYRESSSTPG